MAYNHTTGDGERIFSPVYADVWETNLKNMNGADVKVYIALLMHTTQHDRTWFMSIDEMAEDAGVSRSTAAAAKDRLVKAGLFTQTWRYRDDAGDYHLTDTRPPPRMQGKNVYKVNVKPRAVESENRNHDTENRVRKSEPIESENRNLVESENRNPTRTPSPKHPTEPLSPQPPKGEGDASAAEFDQWWSHVPRKKAKGDARKAFTAARKKASLDELISGIEASKRQWQAEGRDATKIPYPATWLRSESWEDTADEWQVSPQQRGRQTSSNTLDAWMGTAQTTQQQLPQPDTSPFGRFIEHETEDDIPW